MAALSDRGTAAEAAFLRFDWEGVGAATERLAAGTEQLEAAAMALDRGAGAIPAATP